MVGAQWSLPDPGKAPLILSRAPTDWHSPFNDSLSYPTVPLLDKLEHRTLPAISLVSQHPLCTHKNLSVHYYFSELDWHCLFSRCFRLMPKMIRQTYRFPWKYKETEWKKTLHWMKSGDWGQMLNPLYLSFSIRNRRGVNPWHVFQ